MATVVFMRGANVGGHRSFRPAALVERLSSYDVVSLGAAGTFVVRKRVAQSRLRDEFLERLPFEVELLMCRDRDLLDLVSTEPFPRRQRETRRFVTLLAKRPPASVRLTERHPEGSWWQVRLIAVRGRFVLSLWRRMGKRLLYPNQVVERELGIPATTRSWETICKIESVLRAT